MSAINHLWTLPFLPQFFITHSLECGSHVNLHSSTSPDYLHGVVVQLNSGKRESSLLFCNFSQIMFRERVTQLPCVASLSPKTNTKVACPPSSLTIIGGAFFPRINEKDFACTLPNAIVRCRPITNVSASFSFFVPSHCGARSERRVFSAGCWGKCCIMSCVRISFSSTLYFFWCLLISLVALHDDLGNEISSAVVFAVDDIVVMGWLLGNAAAKWLVDW